MDWAICTPISTKGPDCWCLYVSGSTDFIATPDTLSADLRFTALMAEFIGAIRQVRQLEKVHAGMSQFFSPAVVETMSGEFGSSLLAPKISDVMLDTLHADFRPEHVSKQVEFGIAESLAGRRGRTDWAMILDEKETQFVLALDFGHVTFFCPNQCKLSQLFLHGGIGAYSLRVRVLLSRTPGLKNAFDSRGAECVSQGVHQCDAQFCVGSREELVGGGCKAPELRGAANWLGRSSAVTNFSLRRAYRCWRTAIAVSPSFLAS